MNRSRTTWSLSTLAMGVALAACEPEMPAKPAAAVATAATATTPLVGAASPLTPTLPPAPAVTASTPDNGAPAAPAAAPAALQGNITGTVTARPAALGGKNIIVYLADGPKDPPPTAPVVIDQRAMFFIPLVTAVQAGGKVAFVNSDPFPHNVFSPDAEKFNLGTMPHGSSTVHTFEHPGAYTILCNLHPNMIAYVVVTPSGHFARADKDGRYTLSGVPAGTYTLTAWGPRLVVRSQPVTVAAGDVTADFQLQR